MERVDHLGRPQAHRRHVLPARAGYAGPRLRRRDHDAHAAGGRLPLRRLPAARALRPDLFRPRHDHDLLRGDAVRDRADEFRRAAAARRARRRLPDLELGELLADRLRRAAGQRVAADRRVLAGRLDGLSAAVRARLLARSRRRLLSLVVADLGHRHPADRRQFRHHHPEDPCARHDLLAHADLLLDRRSPPIC